MIPVELLQDDREILQKMAEHALAFCFEHADDPQLCALTQTLVQGMHELCVAARLAQGGYTEEQASSLVEQAQRLQYERAMHINANGPFVVGPNQAPPRQ